MALSSNTLSSNSTWFEISWSFSRLLILSGNSSCNEKDIRFIISVYQWSTHPQHSCTTYTVLAEANYSLTPLTQSTLCLMVWRHILVHVRRHAAVATSTFPESMAFHTCTDSIQVYTYYAQIQKPVLCTYIQAHFKFLLNTDFMTKYVLLSCWRVMRLNYVVDSNHHVFTHRLKSTFNFIFWDLCNSDQTKAHIHYGNFHLQRNWWLL